MRTSFTYFETLSRYAAVTFNSLKTSQERLRELIQDTAQSQVLAVNRGKVNLALQKQELVKGADGRGDAGASEQGGATGSSSSRPRSATDAAADGGLDLEATAT